jgi:hypothetical protein
MRKGGRRNGGLEVIALADGLKVFIPGWKHRSCRSYLKEGSQIHVWNRPICGGGRFGSVSSGGLVSLSFIHFGVPMIL